MISLLQALVEHFADRPNLITDGTDAVVAGGDEALHLAVTYVAGMTDRYACRQGVALLGWAAPSCLRHRRRRLIRAQPSPDPKGAPRGAPVEDDRFADASGVDGLLVELERLDVDDLAALALTELHGAVGQGEERVVAATTDVAAGVDGWCRAGAR